MKKKLLSLALALAVCLGLTLPAFAAEAEWKLEVAGKADAEVFVGEKTFTVRDWDFTDSNFTNMVRTDSRQLTAENLCVMSKGDTAVITSGEPFQHLYFMAWSDPDGDGVYDGRLMSASSGEILPANVAEPVYSGPIYSQETGEEEDWVGPYANSVNLYISANEGAVLDPGGGIVPDRTSGQLPADYLLEMFGPNTLVKIDWADWSCVILVEGNTSSPATVTTTATVGGFTDVKTEDYFAKPVAWAVEQGITTGTSATTFSPNDNCTQGQILTFLWHAKGDPEPTGTVSGTQYYATAAQWAKEQGLTDNFSAETDCTRAMVVTYLWQLAGSPEASPADFTDVPANADYAQAVAWAVEQEVTSGDSATTFAPESVCTRGQIVTFLYRALAEQ